MKKPALCALVLCLCLFGAAHGQVLWHHESGLVEVHSVPIGDAEWLFLPAGADLSALTLTIGGETSVVDWLSIGVENPEIPGVYTALLPQTGETLSVTASANVPSLHLQSADPVHFGREWLIDCELREKETYGHLVMLDENGSVFLSETMENLRGRGNSTWQKAEFKNPFQIKLPYRVDLLNTQDPRERGRTWVLLSNEYDTTRLRNQLAYDIALELGMDFGTRSKPVDLFYDGDYRGTYQLAQKVEVGENSVDVRNFDKILKPINERMGTAVAGTLPSPTRLGNQHPEPDGFNEDGLGYGYIDSVYDNKDVDAGGYLLELEGYGAMSDHTWARLPGINNYVSVKNPEYASETMVRYVQRLFLNAQAAWFNYGYHPQTDAKLEDLIDIDSFTRSMLVNELLLCNDCYLGGSTYLVLKEGDSRLYAGPVWDFDVGVQLETAPHLKDNNPYSHAFYRTTVFQDAAKQIWQQDVKPLYEDILFGTGQGETLLSFEQYVDRLRTTWRMDHYRHRARQKGPLNVVSIYNNMMEELEAFLRKQYAFLDAEISQWGGDEVTHEVEVRFAPVYGEGQTGVELVDEPHGSLFLEDAHFDLITPATEEDFAVWQLTLILSPKPHCDLDENAVVHLNGEDYTGAVEEGKLVLRFRYEDPSYRPAVLDGVDYGFVFDYDFYTENYPELLEDFGDDREAILRYFVEEGMAYGDVANAFFDPMLVMDVIGNATERYGTECPRYYQLFMENPGLWMSELDLFFEPELEQIP